MGAALEVLLGSVKLLLDPKVWLLLAVAALGGFVKGCTHEEKVFDQYKATVAAVGAAQEAWTKKRNAVNAAAQKEVEGEYKSALLTASLDLADAQQRLHDDAGGSFVPRPSASPSKSLPHGDAPAQPIVPAAAGSDLLCFSGAELDARIRGSITRLQQRFARLAEQCVASITAEDGWDLWAGKVGACTVKGSPAAPLLRLAPSPQ